MARLILVLSALLLGYSQTQAAALFGRPSKIIDSNDSNSSSAGSSYYTPYTSGSSSYSATGGGCGSVPSHVKTAFSEAKRFTQTCSYAQLAPGKMIAVNDYSGDGRPTMYIFDQDGNCVKGFPISWGVGSDRSGRLEACSTENSRKTPPGFHLTATHNGARYNSSNSLGMAGLSGQDSLGQRGVIIHGTSPAGTSNTWGCTGVNYEDLSTVMKTLGVGSLVYNYFGGARASNCSDNSGMERPAQCQPEAAAVAAARSNGVSSSKYSGKSKYSTSSGGSKATNSTKRKGAK
ncbi:hypothetical protein AZI85_17145 [Bdellovibrio bacteriovorus]|uniref:L,D-TPase catalytic domain-containing protein n=1 Tax=Bdellovibrio bacteriovorus TaxID=959 RepID=A0A150WSX2_BDEBC|nr:L,D-transpeptidase family protein [Bdellovibrio bacteriovorus]KYG67606.1 hypothetical protein AZI85_17145 [Bdellovibrio bacteriovorus]